jgi:hypothetical protein
LLDGAACKGSLSRKVVAIPYIRLCAEVGVK